MTNILSLPLIFGNDLMNKSNSKWIEKFQSKIRFLHFRIRGYPRTLASGIRFKRSFVSLNPS